ncbi:MAG: hypothetical protein ACRCWQ_09435 [Bacilli bacterium]
MSKIISKTREGSRSFSPQAVTHELDQSNLPDAFVSGKQKIGSVTVDELGVGINYPSVQSAISDITNMFQTRIGQVLVFDDASGIDPNGVSMTEQLTITCDSPAGGANGKLVMVYGIPVAVDVGNNESAITTKIIAELQKYRDNNIAFKSIKATTGINNKIDVEFIDTVPHQNFMASTNGVNVIGTTQTSAVPGYGTWSKIAEQSIPGTTSGATVKLNYYRRNA